MARIVFLSGSSCVGKTTVMNGLQDRHLGKIVTHRLTARDVRNKYPELTYDQVQKDPFDLMKIQWAILQHFITTVSTDIAEIVKDETDQRIHIFERSVYDAPAYFEALYCAAIEKGSPEFIDTQEILSQTARIYWRHAEEFDKLPRTLFYFPIPEGIPYDMDNGARPDERVRLLQDTALRQRYFTPLVQAHRLPSGSDVKQLIDAVEAALQLDLERVSA